MKEQKFGTGSFNRRRFKPGSNTVELEREVLVR